MKRYLPLIYFILAIIVPYIIWVYYLSWSEAFDYDTKDQIVIQSQDKKFYSVTLNTGEAKELSNFSTGSVTKRDPRANFPTTYSYDKEFYFTSGLHSKSGEYVSRCPGGGGVYPYWTRDGKYVISNSFYQERIYGQYLKLGGFSLYITDLKSLKCKAIPVHLNGKLISAIEIVGGLSDTGSIIPLESRAQ